MLAGGGAPSVLDNLSLRDACTAVDYAVENFRFDVDAEPSVLRLRASEATEQGFEELRERLEAGMAGVGSETEAIHLKIICKHVIYLNIRVICGKYKMCTYI